MKATIEFFQELDGGVKTALSFDPPIDTKDENSPTLNSQAYGLALEVFQQILERRQHDPK